MTIGEHSIKSSTSTKNLGVTFDSELGMVACQQHHSQLFLSVETAEIHPTITFHGCRENIGPFPHIKSCRLLQHYLITLTVPQTYVVVRIFYGATDVVVRRLQSVLNAAARLISNRRKFNHITRSILCRGISPTGFPSVSVSNSRLQLVFVYNVIHGHGPIYLCRTCNPAREVETRAHLRSAIRGDT